MNDKDAPTKLPKEIRNGHIITFYTGNDKKDNTSIFLINLSFGQLNKMRVFRNTVHKLLEASNIEVIERSIADIYDRNEIAPFNIDTNRIMVCSLDWFFDNKPFLSITKNKVIELLKTLLSEGKLIET